jgi:glycosyltransferase involved in cell wall biosynthesis
MANEREVKEARRIGILLATYNGDRFLEQQLSSLSAQEWRNVDIWASDDGSTDGTLEKLHRWQRKWNKGDFHVVSGPRAGFVENFRSLLSSRTVDTDFVAFCDQDDVWDPDKLASAINLLSRHGQHRPALYCSRTRLVNEEGHPMGLSPLFKRRPAFRNAIVQSIGGGNTQVMNRAAFSMLSESARRTTFVTHDWWSYILVSGAGGAVCYDPIPHVAYRQHGGNLIGHNMGLRAKARRLRLLLEQRFAKWNSINLAALALCDDLLDEESRQVVREFRRIRCLSFPANLIALRRLGLFRQTWQGNIALMFGAAIRSI